MAAGETEEYLPEFMRTGEGTPGTGFGHLPGRLRSLLGREVLGEISRGKKMMALIGEGLELQKHYTNTL